MIVESGGVDGVCFKTDRRIDASLDRRNEDLKSLHNAREGEVGPLNCHGIRGECTCCVRSAKLTGGQIDGVGQGGSSNEQVLSFGLI